GSDDNLRFAQENDVATLFQFLVDRVGAVDVKGHAVNACMVQWRGRTCSNNGLRRNELDQIDDGRVFLILADQVVGVNFDLLTGEAEHCTWRSLVSQCADRFQFQNPTIELQCCLDVSDGDAHMEQAVDHVFPCFKTSQKQLTESCCT